MKQLLYKMELAHNYSDENFHFSPHFFLLIFFFYAEVSRVMPVLKISPKPEEGNWLYTSGDQMVVWIRAYQADPEKIGTYVPPAFIERK